MIRQAERARDVHLLDQASDGLEQVRDDGGSLRVGGSARRGRLGSASTTLGGSGRGSGRGRLASASTTRGGSDGGSSGVLGSDVSSELGAGDRNGNVVSTGTEEVVLGGAGSGVRDRHMAIRCGRGHASRGLLSSVVASSVRGGRSGGRRAIDTLAGEDGLNSVLCAGSSAGHVSRFV